MKWANVTYKITKILENYAPFFCNFCKILLEKLIFFFSFYFPKSCLGIVIYKSCYLYRERTASFLLTIAMSYFGLRPQNRPFLYLDDKNQPHSWWSFLMPTMPRNGTSQCLCSFFSLVLWEEGRLSASPWVTFFMGAKKGKIRSNFWRQKLLYA